MFLSTLQRKNHRFQIPPVRRAFSKRFSDGLAWTVSLNVGNKAAFSKCAVSSSCLWKVSNPKAEVYKIDWTSRTKSLSHRDTYLVYTRA